MPGCQATQKATAFLAGFKTSGDVAILRLDVPLPSGQAGISPSQSPSPDQGKLPFPRRVDEGRKIAEQLDFFYYPTFYILDREGLVRFAGECTPGEVERMVEEIRLETPASEKHIYTKPLPAVGESARDFSGSTIDGRTMGLKDLKGKKGTILFFGSTFCPFSREAATGFAELQKQYKGKGVSFAVINKGEAATEIKSFYQNSTPGIPVIVDEKQEISLDKYGVQAVPFFYILDESGKIADRRPFTTEAARLAIEALLTGKTPADKTRTKGAG